MRSVRQKWPPQVTHAITGRVPGPGGVMTELGRLAERWYGKRGKGT
jgi:hypothetical protein